MRNIYYKQGDGIRYRKAHKLVRNEVRLDKLRYKEKVETMFKWEISFSLGWSKSITN